MLTLERVYPGRDNSIDVRLMADGAAVDLASVTRMTLSFGDLTIDSEQAAGVFDWGRGQGVVVIAPGGQAIPAGDYQARLVVYDDEHTQGIVWGDIGIRVEPPAPEGEGS